MDISISLPVKTPGLKKSNSKPLPNLIPIGTTVYITAECYAPNTVSRVMDSEWRIIGLTNHYSRISFNFGPTLFLFVVDTFLCCLAGTDPLMPAYRPYLGPALLGAHHQYTL